MDPDAQSAAMRAVAEASDRAAFATLFVHFAPKVKSWAIGAGAAPAVAEEIAQETMLRLWRRAEQYDPDKAAVAAWVFAIARNARIDQARREMRLRRGDAAQEEDDRIEESAEDRTVAAARDALLRAALKNLPEEQSAVVRLAYFDQKPQSAIAETLGAPLGTIKSRLRLAMRKLRKDLEER